MLLFIEVLIRLRVSRLVYTFFSIFFFFQAEDGIRDLYVTGVQTCALPISSAPPLANPGPARGGAEGSPQADFRGGRPWRAAAPAPKAHDRPRHEAAAHRERSEERRVGKECRSRWSA